MVSPSFCSANRTGGSTTSTPTGSLCRPRFSSSTLIFSRDVFGASHLGRHRAAHQGNAGARALAQPRTIELMMPGGRSEVPEDRLVVLRQQRETADLVLRPRADVRRRDVAHVVHVEAQHRAHLGLGQQFLDARQAFPAQPIEIDPLLPIDRHRSVGSGCHDCLLTSNLPSCRLPATSVSSLESAKPQILGFATIISFSAQFHRQIDHLPLRRDRHVLERRRERNRHVHRASRVTGASRL